MSNTVIIGIIILFAVSILVRIIPAFIHLPFSENTQKNIKFVLPLAVFINLIAYCIYSEIHKNHLAALLGFAVLFFLLLTIKRINLLTTVCSSSIVFVLLKHYL